MHDIQAAPPLRADARRNRDALLRAARVVFADQGLEAPLDAIAREAGVGRATLYRRFPTRDTLIAAISEDELEALTDAIENAPDPDRAYFDFLDLAFQMQLENLGFIELFTRKQADPELLQSITQKFYDLITPPLKRAQDAGLVRADFTPDDTGNLLLMVGAVTASMRSAPDGHVRRSRAIEMLYDGVDPARAPRTLPTGN